MIIRMALETERNHRSERSQAHRDSVWGAWHTQLHTERGEWWLGKAESSMPRQWSVLNLQIRLILGSYRFVAELGCKSTGVPPVMVYRSCQFSGIWDQLKDIFLSVCEGISWEG